MCPIRGFPCEICGDSDCVSGWATLPSCWCKREFTLLMGLAAFLAFYVIGMSNGICQLGGFVGEYLFLHLYVDSRLKCTR